MNEEKFLKKKTVTNNPVFIKYRIAHLVLVCAIGLLFAGNSIAGIVFSDTIYPASDLYNSFLPNDYINLFFGIPVLFASVVLTLQTVRIGLIGWISSLMFILYNDIAYIFAVRNGFSLITNFILTLLCIIGLILLATSLNYKLLTPVSPRVRHSGIYGAILVVMGLIFVARALVNIINSASGNVDLSLPDVGVNIADMVLCSFWIISGILLIGKKRSGYIAGLVSYLHGSLLFLTLIIFLMIQPPLCGTEFLATDLFVIAIMSLVLLIPCILLMRGFSSKAKNE
jgi:hypothetical protein